jgi:hypothetical protein
MQLPLGMVIAWGGRALKLCGSVAGGVYEVNQRENKTTEQL